MATRLNVQLETVIAEQRHTIAEFDSIVTAEKAIWQIEEYDPENVHLGVYTIDATEAAVAEYECGISVLAMTAVGRV